MARVYNFSAGPSMLPEKVLRQAQAELLEYGDSGQSVMEMSHRSKWFDAIITETEATLRRVMNIPDHYKVGFFQGGATQQFAMVPLNFMTTGLERIMELISATSGTPSTCGNSTYWVPKMVLFWQMWM